jgi:P27 family predicted phage terminase small subunit
VLPDPPAILTKPAKEEWLRVSVELYRLGLLTLVDVQILAAYCQAYGRWIAAERAIARMAERDQLSDGLMIKTTNGNAIQNPLVGTANKAASDMVRYATEFGLTPAARARLAIGPIEHAKEQVRRAHRRLTGARTAPTRSSPLFSA